MKKIWLALMTTLTGLVLLFSYRTSLGEAVTAAQTTELKPAATTSDTHTATAVPSTSAGGLAAGTFLGDAVSTRYGAVQVQITVANGVISAVDVPQFPNSGGRDRAINSRAIPQLVSATIDKSTANVDLVSGATYTSDGYAQSLQSAIDRARA